MAYPTEQVIQKFIKDDDAKMMIEAADEIGKKLAKDLRLTTNQIRNIFSTVRQINMNWAKESYRQVVLLKPKLAYQAKRVQERGGASRDALSEFENVFKPALDAVINAPESEREKYFGRVTDYLEAIIAYHKKHGGQ